jgi:hypothetical protein
MGQEYQFDSAQGTQHPRILKAMLPMQKLKQNICSCTFYLAEIIQ